MKLLYDPDSDTAYITLRDESRFLQSMPVSDSVWVDIGVNGKVHGILLLDARKQLTQNGWLLIEACNQASGEKQEFVLEW